MSNITYLSCVFDALTGAIDFDTDTFKALLVTSSYAPNETTHTKRSHVTNEVVGAGYTAGGQVVTLSVTSEPLKRRVVITPSAPSWPSSTITAARGMVIYKSRGGAASADELVGYADFGADFTSTAGTFAVTITTPLYVALL